MKTVILAVLGASLLFATTPDEREANLKNVVDMSIKNTQQVEKRISEIQVRLEKKAQEREEKERIREAKLKKLDDDLNAKAKQRAESIED